MRGLLMPQQAVPARHSPESIQRPP